ncbi:hypothetical protein RvVAR0630_18470 [Agrobacterium vitis]|nr:hypothetical protein RvVAR0630_18470 [Agrobacterium vitis]
MLSVPAYWGGPSGIAKNLLDVLGGALYDNPLDQSHERALPLENCLVALVVIGAAADDAKRADAQLRVTVRLMGGEVVSRSFLCDNPRTEDPETLIRTAWDYAAFCHLEFNGGAR